MGTWELPPAQQPQALPREALAALRHGRAAGLSRRTLLRRSLGAGVALWLTETLAGTIGFMWPNLSSGLGSEVVLGTLVGVVAAPAPPGPSPPGPPRDAYERRTDRARADPSRAGQRDRAP